jgi:hypothetical protein
MRGMADPFARPNGEAERAAEGRGAAQVQAAQQAAQAQAGKEGRPAGSTAH